MDRNAFTGLILIGAILFAWQFLTSPSAEELEQQRQRQDSLALVQQEQALAEAAQLAEEEQADTTQSDSLASLPDSARQAALQAEYGLFAPSAIGEARQYTLKNDRIRASVSSEGAVLELIELTQFTTYDSLPLLLMDADSTRLNWSFDINGKAYPTEDLFFSVVSQNDSSLALRAVTSNPGQHIDVIYTLPSASDFIYVAIQSTIPGTAQKAGLDWRLSAWSKEKSLQQEDARTTGYYKYFEDSPDYLSERSSETIELEARTHWISFKQQFFTATLINEQGFSGGSLSILDLESPDHTKTFGADVAFPLADGRASFRLYAGPNKYRTLNKLDLGLEDQVDLGWGIFGWISKILIIPVFDFLSSLNLHYGLIILLLTLFIKLLLFPVTYKTYLSSAKMRALRPEIDEINAQFKKGEEVKKQQAVMALYQKTGVNPFSGCIPMLIQFPILFAMFRFFPASIELRGQSFLWADDLSSYDSIFSWDEHIWLLSDIYGNHISGFTLLMAISTFFYTKLNTQVTMTTNSMQAQQMKIMTYFMPVMLLFFFNGYAAGLSLYYFTANVTTMIQQYVIKKFFINEDKIREKLQENKKKDRKKSRFQRKLDELSEQQKLNQNRQMRRKK